MQSIIYVHKGNPFYLALSLKQAKRSNPNANIILLGDDSNNKFDFVKHYNISDYFDRASKFDSVYVNHSPNARAYELFCFQRWMIIWEFQKKHPEYKDSFVYCDTDTLLFDDVIADLNHMGNNIIALEGEVGPAFTFFNMGGVNLLCDTIEWFYMTEDGKNYLNRFVDEQKRSNSIHGFSDMYALEYFVKNKVKGRVIDAQKDYRGSWENDGDVYFRYDMNVNFKEEFDLTKNKIKKFIIRDGKPYAYSHALKKDVLFKGIHFQGKAKYEMIKFLNLPTPFFSSLWKQYYIIYQLKKIKKSFNNINKLKRK